MPGHPAPGLSQIIRQNLRQSKPGTIDIPHPDNQPLAARMFERVLVGMD